LYTHKNALKNRSSHSSRGGTQRFFSQSPFTPSGVSVRRFTKLAPLANPEDFESKQVPVVTFKEGKRREQIIPVPEGLEAKPVKPAGVDVKKRARRFDPAVTGKLTPTLQKFLLPGKIAVVTG
jgi:hypothetical protein